MHGLGCTMPTLEILNVLNVGLLADGEAGCFKPANTELQAIERHDFGGVLADVVNQLWQIEDTGRDFCLELRAACEYHN